MSEFADTGQLLRRALVGLLLLGLVVMAFRIVQPFIAAVAWALILCYVTWPAYVRLRTAVGDRANLAALLMTLFLGTALVVPMAWLVLLLEGEVVNMYQSLIDKLSAGPIVLPQVLRELPVIGDELQNIVARLGSSPEALNAEAARLAAQWRAEITGLVGGVGKNLAKFAFALLTAFFVYRDGEALLAQISAGMRMLVGVRESDYLDAAGATTRAVVYGIVLTAIAQGIIAGIGYWIFGAPGPVFLAAITMLIAMIPFGTPFVWGGVAVWMIINGDVWGGVGLAVWGTLVVSWVDNIIRPLVISSATRIPFIIVMFGVLGGLATFGMVGLFIGPVVLAVLLAVWREWLEGQSETAHRD